jgi:catechol 2,3-dioxygenase-like lactoylglutathione lyase family enzyme
MNRALALSVTILCWLSIATVEQPSRPHITSVAFVRLKSTDLEKSSLFYTGLLGLRQNPPASRDVANSAFRVREFQDLQLIRNDARVGSSLLESTGFYVDDLDKMRSFLSSREVAFSDCTSGPKGPGAICVSDPEGHRIIFVESPFVSGGPNQIDSPRQASNRLIHAGFVVHGRAAEDRFYKDLLGFHVYWHGGMKDDETNWVDMQVPDGTDWIEYMLNVPADADKQTLGVMNHIALGVSDIHAAQQQLIKNGWKSTEQPKIGRDGKWQLNLYDPDDTRVELMEFTPVEKPCCSEYTGPHPKP